MTPVEIALIAIAVVFAVFAGANDGGTLLAVSLKLDPVRPATVAVVLTLAVAAAPIVLGTRVATTLAGRLVHFDAGAEASADLALLLAVAGAVAVVALLSRGGLPTSLTLALIGGMLGVGLGGGLAVSWGWTVFVLAVAAVAPFAGLAMAVLILRLWHALSRRGSVGRQVRYAQLAGLALQGVAYGTNDGQKMLAVFALAVPAAIDDGRVVPPVWMVLAVGGLFAVGMLLGVRRYGMRLGSTVGAFTPVRAVTTQLSAALAVTGSAAAGAPASMTQSITGALLGSGLGAGMTRIRWDQAVKILVAWVVTVPVALAVVALPAALLLRT